ncbi:MAG: BamA/TamA family outer membrane protein [Lautropia sp.]|nr:BamA/TamA family outer membrane protein [Lautropia sp.]
MSGSPSGAWWPRPWLLGVLLALLVGGCAGAGNLASDTEGQQDGAQRAAGTGGVQANTGADRDSGDIASDTGGAEASSGRHTGGADTGSRRRRNDGPLLGTRNNYRFDIHAPMEFREDIESSTLLGRWRRRTDYDPVQFEGLVGKLQEEVLAISRDKGYFNPDIQIEYDPPSQVSLRLKPGVRARVRALDFQIEGQGKGSRMLAGVQQQLGLSVGEVFLPGEWQSGKKAVLEAMQRHGFLRARIKHSRVQVDAAKASARLSLVVDTGPRIAFGPLQIQGLERYSEKTIEDLRTFKRGDPFSERELQLFQRRLREAGYFSSVSAVPDLLALQTNPELPEVPIQLVVDEMQRYHLVYGLGYSTDDGPRGQIGLRDRNFYGLQMETSLMLSERRQRAFANYRTPYDADNHYYGFGYLVEREDDNSVISLRSNLYAGYGHRNNDIESFTSLQLQQEEERFRSTGEREGLKALVLGKAWTLQRFDSALDPARGYGLRFEISGASRRVFSDRTFTRYYLSAIRFQPFPRDSMLHNGTLVLRTEFGVVHAGGADDIPSENLFRTGGSQSIRGYGYRSLGLNVDNKRLGERYLAVGSVEYQHRVSEMMSLVAFFDHGNVSHTWRRLDGVSGYGVGGLAHTPIGPVRLDVAYGQALHRWRLHFSIGFIF